MGGRTSFPAELWIIALVVPPLAVAAGMVAWGAVRDGACAETAGTVESVDVQRSRPNVRGGPFYDVVVRYRYAVDDREYVGDRYARGWEGDVHQESFKEQRKAVARAQALRSRETVPVYYEPGDPSQSFLVRRPHSDAYFPGGLALLGLLWSLMRIVPWLRSRRREEPQAARPSA